jgi:glutamine amidotransferase
MIGIINYGVGNVKSVFNMLNYLNIPNKIIDDPNEIYSCNKLILPGVGSFDNGMNSLLLNGWIQPINSHIEKKRPLLGICLGMQLLGKSSEEGSTLGLNLLPFKVLRFPPNKQIKIPHMGWNQVELKSNHLFFEKIKDYEHRYYFVHSYYVPIIDNLTIMKSNYGIDFSAGVIYQNIMGFQFHPEKSHKYGLLLLKEFNDYYDKFK